MFIDYVTLLLVNIIAGLVTLALFIHIDYENTENYKKWVPSFLVIGLIAFINGTHMIWNWPLPGSYNSIFGELTVLFGSLFLSAALVLFKGYDLKYIFHLGIIFGLIAVLLGASIIYYSLTQTPLYAGICFILTGVAGLFLPLLLCSSQNLVFRKSITIYLLFVALLWASIGFPAYWMHAKMFIDWKPMTMQK